MALCSGLCRNTTIMSISISAGLKKHQIMKGFSIIVTYNGSKCIRRVLDSLAEMEQGLPISIVVVDN
jgi:hypothetical protein